MSRRWSAAHPKSWILVALGTVLLNAWVIGHFHDRFWWAPDEGNYAHVAERILDGEVLHAEVQDIHPGYVNFTNAAAMAVFGRRLVSLRYPLIGLGVAQCLLMFLILRPAGLFPAAVGATAVTALGFVQFLNPTAHWYCLFLVIALAAVLHLAPRQAPWRLPVAGALIMTAVLFRQLSGVLIAIGALTWLLLEASAEERSALRRSWLAPALALLMLAGLTAYLWRATDALGLLLFGLWPIALLLHAVRTARVADAKVAAVVLSLATGAAIAALPLVVYHVGHGSFGAWYRDVIVSAVRLPRMPFFATASHADLLTESVRAMTSGTLTGIVNGAFWVVMTLAAAIGGAMVLGLLMGARRTAVRRPPPALAVLAIFYSVVSVHYQIPIYLAYTMGLSVAALLLLRRGSALVPAIGAAAVAVAVYYHAGQPLSRGISGTASGRRVDLSTAPGVPRAGLRIEETDARTYAELLAVIEREAPPDASILALPSRAELYFLSGRRNPFRFFNSALGIRSGDELAAALETLEREPPALVLHDRGDKYNTDASRSIIERIAGTYEALPSVGRIDIYRRPGPLAQLPPVPASRP